jgi:hypothetical protein
MALYTNYSLFVDVENGVASKSFQDVSPLTSPAFFKGDRCVLNVYFVKPNNYGSAPYSEVVISGLASVNVAIGTSTAVATSTSGLTALSAATASVSTVVAYSSGVNQIDRITISPEPKGGTFSLLYDGTTIIGPISVNASASDIASLMTSMGSLSSTTFTVTKVGNFSWDVEWNAGTYAPPDALTANSSGIISFAGYEIVLDMTTAGVTTLLAGAASAEATLEISTTQTTGSYVQTAAQIPCTVFEDIL